MFAPPSRSGLTTKKFAGTPAAAAFALRVALPIRPVVFADANPNGFGLRAARKPRNVELVQFAPEYAAVLPAWLDGWPLKNARNVGSGAVPAAPV